MTGAVRSPPFGGVVVDEVFSQGRSVNGGEGRKELESLSEREHGSGGVAEVVFMSIYRESER